MGKVVLGERVGAVRNDEGNKVYMFGFGTYEGEEVPPEGVVGAFGVSLRKLGRKNPKIKLDNGNFVWGCQCWWGKEDTVRKMFEGKELIFVGVDE